MKMYYEFMYIIYIYLTKEEYYRKYIENCDPGFFLISV